MPQNKAPKRPDVMPCPLGLLLEAPGGHVFAAPDGAHDRGAEGPRGVDAAAVHRQQQHVRQEDREADRDAGVPMNDYSKKVS